MDVMLGWQRGLGREPPGEKPRVGPHLLGDGEAMLAIKEPSGEEGAHLGQGRGPSSSGSGAGLCPTGRVRGP